MRIREREDKRKGGSEDVRLHLRTSSSASVLVTRHSAMAGCSNARLVGKEAIPSKAAGLG